VPETFGFEQAVNGLLWILARLQFSMKNVSESIFSSKNAREKEFGEISDILDPVDGPRDGNLLEECLALGFRVIESTRVGVVIGASAFAGEGVGAHRVQEVLRHPVRFGAALT